MSEIFGYGGYSGWRLNTLDAKCHNDEVLYKKVYSFLHPFGPMFKLIKKLNNDNIALELSSSVLPVSWIFVSLRRESRKCNALVPTPVLSTCWLVFSFKKKDIPLPVVQIITMFISKSLILLKFVRNYLIDVLRCTEIVVHKNSWLKRFSSSHDIFSKAISSVLSWSASRAV